HARQQIAPRVRWCALLEPDSHTNRPERERTTGHAGRSAAARVRWCARALGGWCGNQARVAERIETERLPMPELRTLLTGIAFGEQPRWHDDRLWFSDWGSREVVAVDLDGQSEVILQAPSFPCCVDWLPDGDLLVVSGRDGLLLRRQPD